MTPLLPPHADYDAARAGFRWPRPARFNIASLCCDRWAAHSPDQVCLIEVDGRGAVTTIDYRELRDRANRLANALHRHGVRPGDRVAILLPQGTAVPIAHMGVYKLGAIALPLASLFGVEALAYRLADSGASALITDAAGLAKLRSLPTQPPALGTILCTDGGDGVARSWEQALATSSTAWVTRDTAAEDPALMIYTSGTTGQPKGALHAHRVLIGHFPGVEMPHEGFPRPGDRLWTPADWAWAGGLLNILLPGLAYGVPVVARRFERFDPEAAFDLMARHDVRNVFLPPTALRMLRAVARPRERFHLQLRTLASGGEALGSETFAWGREALGVTINEFYGQTEANLIVSSSGAMGVSTPGSMGKAVPGHEVAVIRDDGSRCEAGERGTIALRRPDPVMFLGYWNRPEATAAKFIGDWMTTGDLATMDADGSLRFVGRDDDVITSSGYRIGPAEIEDCLGRHAAVLLAAAVGKPDPLRTEIVKAFVVLKPGWAATPELASDIQDFVRTRLSAHEYPREIAFVPELPLTTTGKVIRRLLRERA